MNTAAASSANFSNVVKLIDTMNVARTHGESVRAEMGDAWVQELLDWHQNNLATAVSLYVEGIDDQAMRTLCAKNLLAQAGITL